MSLAAWATCEEPADHATGGRLPEDARLPAGLLSDAELTDPLARGLKTIYPQQTRSHKV